MCDSCILSDNLGKIKFLRLWSWFIMYYMLCSNGSQHVNLEPLGAFKIVKGLFQSVFQKYSYCVSRIAIDTTVIDGIQAI